MGHAAGWMLANQIWRVNSHFQLTVCHDEIAANLRSSIELYVQQRSAISDELAHNGSHEGAPE